MHEVRLSRTHNVSSRVSRTYPPRAWSASQSCTPRRTERLAMKFMGLFCPRGFFDWVTFALFPICSADGHLVREMREVTRRGDLDF